MNDITKLRYDILGPVVAQALNKRYFDACYCSDKEAALMKALEWIDPAQTVAYGGSLSLNELNIKEALRQRAIRCLTGIWPEAQKKREPSNTRHSPPTGF